MNDQTSLVASKPDQLPAAQTQGAALVTAQSREIAQQQALFAMAQRFPRDLDIFREKILKECKNATFAELAIYDLPFGKEHVRGGSIRLAEGIYRAMQWFALDVRMVGDTPSMPGRPGFRTWRVEMLDIQNGTPSSLEAAVEKTVERRSPPSDRAIIATRTTSEGNTVFVCEATASELLAKENAATSKMRRNLILARVERSLMDEIQAEIRKTNESEADRDPDAARRRMLDGFAEIGVDADELKRYCGQELSTLSPKQIVDLRELWSGISDGFCTWADALADKGLGSSVPANDGARGAGPVQSLMERIAARRNASGSQPIQQTSAPSSAPPAQPSASTQPSETKPTAKELRAELARKLNDSPKVCHDAVKATYTQRGKKSLTECNEADLSACLVALEKEIARESH